MDYWFGQGENVIGVVGPAAMRKVWQFYREQKEQVY